VENNNFPCRVSKDSWENLCIICTWVGRRTQYH